MADEEIPPFNSEEEHLEAEAGVLHPKLASKTIAFGPIEVAIRALPLEIDRQLTNVLSKAKKSEQVGEIEDYYSRALQALMVLVRFYAKDDEAPEALKSANEEWVANNIPMDMAITILNQQTEVGNASRFLHSAVRALFEPMYELCRGVDEADLTVIREYGRTLFQKVPGE